MQTHTIITGDIGGTNARLGLWKCGPGAKNVEVYSETYSTSTFPTFEECLQAFLDEQEVGLGCVQQEDKKRVQLQHSMLTCGEGKASITLQQARPGQAAPNLSREQ